ncbi:MAG: Mth938-like domain-containing protein [Comamonas sp.]
MKLHADRSDVQLVTGYGSGWIAVNKQEHRGNILLGSSGLLRPWDCTDFASLTAAHFAALAEFNAELIIFGSGSRLRFVHPSWLQPLMQKRIGLETMDTHAACRTYNVLAGEGRNVIAALLLE